ncbi:AP complex subunit beta [Vairimorpha necatrix]|uniref:AP complex subunit beta n=1 Tax=Vairimorpha necatrix TaxID=6039 RepID=A0AAX4J9T9_9MICR
MNFFKTNKFITEKYSNDKLILLLKSTSPNDNIDALKYILCKIQEGYDFTLEFDYVIKLIDTTNRTLKKLTNEYFKYFFKIYNEDERRLLLVNTFLKDFSDMSEIIINYIVELSDKSIINSFLSHIIKYLKTTNNKRQAYYVAYACDKKFGTEVVKQLTEDWKDPDYLHIISLTNHTMPDNIILSNIYNNANLIPILRKMYYEKAEFSNCNIIKILLKKDNLQLFYYTCKIILFKYPEYLQDAYNQSLIHMDTTPENLYNILLLHEEMLEYVKYSNFTYIIYGKDPDYIKLQKIRILFKNLDEFSVKEIGRHNFVEIIEYSIAKDCLIFEDVFYENEINKVINSLYKVHKEDKLKYVIQKYLIFLIDKHEDMKQDLLKKYVYLCSMYFDDDLLPVITASFNTILSYHLNLYKRDIYDKNGLIKSLQKYKHVYNEKVKALTSLIETDISSLLQFQDKIKEKVVKKVQVDLFNNLLDSKPYQENSTGVINTTQTKSESFDLEINTKSKIVKENLMKTFIIFRDIEKDKILVDHDSIKGEMFLRNNILILSIDVLEKDTFVECITEGNTQKITLSKESKVPLCDISNVDNVKIIFNESQYEVSIRNKISKHSITKEVWEKEFNRLTKYKLVENINMDEVFKIDDERFSFLVYDEKVYGRVYNDQIILKGNEKILKDF